MNPKYSNIFWHQGIKVFEETVLKSKQGQIKVAHLENDVTKALINLFQHCSPKVLRDFLQMIPVKEAPEAFQFDFQVTDTISYRQKANRVMLSIISASTQIKSNSYHTFKKSIPDACIYSGNTSILIEAKTQGPLFTGQIETHIKNYLGTANKQRTITWEDISEKFKLISDKLPPFDRFLVTHFCKFLELIGIAKFDGFSLSDFEMMGAIGKISSEDYLDFKRMFNRKAEKFTNLLDEEIRPILLFKNFGWKTSKVTAKGPGTFSAFYFYDKDPNIHVNKYPNINFNFDEYGITLSFNSETKSSMNYMLKCIKKNPLELDKRTNKIEGFNFLLFYKIQYFPMNNFLWDIVPGFPIVMTSFKSIDIIKAIDEFDKQWISFRDTQIYQMKSGRKRHSSVRFFSEKEIEFASEKNKKPIYTIRILRQYPALQVAEAKKKIIPFFKKEILKLKPLIELVVA